MADSKGRAIEQNKVPDERFRSQDRFYVENNVVMDRRLNLPVSAVAEGTPEEQAAALNAAVGEHAPHGSRFYVRGSQVIDAETGGPWTASTFEAGKLSEMLNSAFGYGAEHGPEHPDSVDYSDPDRKPRGAPGTRSTFVKESDKPAKPDQRDKAPVEAPHDSPSVP